LTLCSSQEDLDVRLGFDLCEQEKDFICKRKKVVAAALKDILQLEEDLEDDEVAETIIFCFLWMSKYSIFIQFSLVPGNQEV